MEGKDGLLQTAEKIIDREDSHFYHSLDNHKTFLGLGPDFMSRYRGRKALDIGAGKGTLVDYLRSENIQAVGIDARPPSDASSHVKKGNILESGYQDAEFDLVISYCAVPYYNFQAVRYGFKQEDLTDEDIRLNWEGIITGVASLKEALRIARVEMRFFPGGNQKLFESTGLITTNLSYPKTTNLGSNDFRDEPLPIDFKKLFGDCGLECSFVGDRYDFRPGVTADQFTYQALSLKKADKTTLAPFDTLLQELRDYSLRPDAKKVFIRNDFKPLTWHEPKFDNPNTFSKHCRKLSLHELGTAIAQLTGLVHFCEPRGSPSALKVFSDRLLHAQQVYESRKRNNTGKYVISEQPPSLVQKLLGKK